MQVGAIGGGMAAGAMTGAATAGATAGATAAGEASSASAQAGTTTTKSVTEQLPIDSQAAKPWETVAEMGAMAMAESLQDFNSIDLLIALLLMAAMKPDDDDSVGSTALGFLVGLALASRLGQSGSSQSQPPVQETTAPGDVGGNINLTA